MDPVLYLWKFEHWLEDQYEKNELAKNHAYLCGMFTNPELAAKLSGNDGSQQHSSDDEDLEKSMEMVKSQNEGNISKRKKRKLHIK